MLHPTSSIANRLQRVLEAAERAIGIHGTDGVSLRQICADAGYRNHYTVQYHFGDKTALVDAIFAWRVPLIEQARAARLAALPDPAAASLSDLIGVMLLPITELTDDEGDRIYARFLTRMGFLGQGAHQPRWRQPADVARIVFAMMQARLPHLPMALFRARFAQVGAMLFETVVNQDLARAAGIDQPPPALVIDDLFGMAAVALAAEAGPGVTAWFASTGAI